MARVIKAHKVGVLFVAIFLGVIVAASCLVDFGGKGPPLSEKASALSYMDNPSTLPVEGLIDDLFFLHYHHSPEDHPRWLVKLMVGLRHALGTLHNSTYELMQDIDHEQVDPEVYPSISDLPKEEQTATVILTALELSPCFEGDWAEVVRLAYGDSKSVLEVAFALNEANDFPMTNDELEQLPLRGLKPVRQVARAYDRISGCRRRHCRAEPETIIDNPVIQWLVAYRAGKRARHKLSGQCIPKRHWKIETEDELNLLMYLLGDHEPPPAPILDPVVSPTSENPIMVSGNSEVLSFIGITGGQDAAYVQANENGDFSATILLWPNQLNVLSAAATDRAGNAGPAVEVSVVHDEMPPEVEIVWPKDGYLTAWGAVDVAGNVSGGSIVSVTVNGTQATIEGTLFYLDGLLLLSGSNLIEAIAVDQAGNVGMARIAAHRITEEEGAPGAFGVVGPEGGIISIDDPDNPFSGASVEIPEGALDEETMVIIREGLDAPPMEGFVPVGPIFEMLPPDIDFAVPATITLPYNESLIPHWSSEGEIKLYMFKEGFSVWEMLDCTVVAEDDRIVAQVHGFSMVVAGSPFAPVPQFCGSYAATQMYDCSTVPHEHPTVPWVMDLRGHEEPTSLTSDGEKFFLYAMNDDSDVFFWREEESIATSEKYGLELKVHITDYEPTQQPDIGFISYGFTTDGEKAAAIITGPDVENGNIIVLLKNYQFFIIEGEADWFNPTTYRILVDKTLPIPSMKVYVDKVGVETLVAEIPYDDLIDSQWGTGSGVGFGGHSSNSVWDFVSYDICGSPDVELHAPWHGSLC